MKNIRLIVDDNLFKMLKEDKEKKQIASWEKYIDDLFSKNKKEVS